MQKRARVARRPSHPGELLLVLCCSAAAAAAALIYEIVWYQLLAARDRFDRDIARRSARDFHGRPLHRQPVRFRVLRTTFPAPAIRLTVFALIEFAIASWRALELLLIPLAGDIVLRGPQAGSPA